MVAKRVAGAGRLRHADVETRRRRESDFDPLGLRTRASYCASSVWKTSIPACMPVHCSLRLRDCALHVLVEERHREGGVAVRRRVDHALLDEAATYRSNTGGFEMPTTSVRRLISPLRHLIRLVECSLSDAAAGTSCQGTAISGVVVHRPSALNANGLRSGLIWAKRRWKARGVIWRRRANW